MSDSQEKSKDRILQSYISSFVKDYGLEELSTSDQFEVFTSYLALNERFPLAVRGQEPQDLYLGGGDEKGLDGVIIVLNNTYVVNNMDDLDEVRDRLRSLGHKKYDLDYIITQAKTSPSFMKDKVLNSFEGLESFISDEEVNTTNINLKERLEVRDALQDIWAQVDRASVYFYYFTQSRDPLEFEDDIKRKINRINKQNKSDYKGGIKFIPCGLPEIKDMYKTYTRSNSIEFKVDRLVSSPETDGVEKSYMAYIRLDEFLKIISFKNIDNKGKFIINESVFEDNVRSYQGRNEVNSKIMDTLKSENKRKMFFVLNNGITIITQELNYNDSSNLFNIDNFQIVNGCQTSNVLYEYYLDILDEGFSGNELFEKLHEIFIPVRIIQTKDDEVMAEIVQSTNSQTSITQENLVALRREAREIQDYFDSIKDSDGKQIVYYERRSHEYSAKNNLGQEIPQVRVIDLQKMLNAYASMYLEFPNKASRYAGDLREPTYIESVFNKKNHPIQHFGAAYASIQYDYWIRKYPSSFGKSLKWHVLMVLSIITGLQNKFKDIPNSHNDSASVEWVKNAISDENIIISFNIIMNFIEESDEYSYKEIRKLNKTENFIKGVKSYIYKNKYNNLENVKNNSALYTQQSVVKGKGRGYKPLTSKNVYDVLLKVDGNAANLFNMIASTIENDNTDKNFVYRWQDSSSGRTGRPVKYEYSICISDISPESSLEDMDVNAVRVGSILYRKTTKDFKVRVGLQHRQLQNHSNFYEEFVNEHVRGFSCILPAPGTGSNKKEHAHFEISKTSPEKLFKILKRVIKRTYAIKK